MVENLGEGEILELIKNKKRCQIPINASIFYYNDGNFERLMELVKEGKLGWVNCLGACVKISGEGG